LHLYAELTQRECEVLELIEQGMNNQEIANVLCIEMGTVKNHVHNIFDKFGVRTRKQAAIIARQALTTHRVGTLDDDQAAMLSGGSSYPPELKSELTVTYPRQATPR
jgi:DNA-binding CsgD family transcriptional regulator